MRIENQVISKATIDNKEIKFKSIIMNDCRWEMIKDRLKITKKIFDEFGTELFKNSYGVMFKCLEKSQANIFNSNIDNTIYDKINSKFNDEEIRDAYLFLDEFLPFLDNGKDNYKYPDSFTLHNEKVVTDYSELFVL